MLVHQCDAERARVNRADQPRMWEEIASGWAAAQRPLRQAYALARLADSYGRSGARDRARTAAQQAYAVAERIGAEPLRNYVTELARRLHLRLGKPQPYGLTPKQLQVLRELTSGRTNREIGKALFMAPGTVSIHVSEILRRLDVPNRGSAADLARREGLVDD